MMKRKLRNALFTFGALIVVNVTAGVIYLQSEHFANFVKRLISDRSDQDIGVVGDFKNLRLHFFPPGIGIANPVLNIKRENIANIPVEAKIEATEVRITFEPIQMFSGTLQIQEFAVIGGAIFANTDVKDLKKRSKKKKSKEAEEKFRLSDLFQVQVNGVSLQDTFVMLDVANIDRTGEGSQFQFVVDHLSLSKTEYQKNFGLESEAVVRAMKAQLPAEMAKRVAIKQAYELAWKIEIEEDEIRWKQLTVGIEGLAIRATGQIRGDLFNEAVNPSVSSSIEAAGDLETFSRFHLKVPDVAGDVELTAQVESGLKDFEKTLNGTVEFEGKEAVWKTQKFGLLKGEATFHLGKRTFSIKRLEATAPDGKSGTWSMAPFETTFDFDRTFQTQIQVQEAEFHWFGGLVLKEIFLLEGLLSGSIDVRFDPKGSSNRKWKLDVTPNLEVQNFGLTNQKYGVVRPKKFILRPVLPVKLSGPVGISNMGASFPRLLLELRKTRLSVEGSIDQNGEVKIEAQGAVDLRELDQIAGTNIRGLGEVKAHVKTHSGNLRLDFDADLRETEYLNLHLGSLNGRIGYDDELPEVIFSNLKGEYRQTRYQLREGYVNLSENQEIFLPIELDSGQIQDISEMLGVFTKKLTWFPRDLVGELNGKVEISGPLGFDEMEIIADVNGSDWTWFGERARKIRMRAGVDRGTFFARNIELTKTNGKILGAVSFESKSEVLDWNLRTDQFSLTDLDLIDRVEIPARSKISIESQGTGQVNRLTSKTLLRLTDTVIKGDALEASQAELIVSDRILTFDASLFGKSLKAKVRQALTPKQPSQFQLELSKFDFSPILLILNPKLLDDRSLKAEVNGAIQLDYLSEQAELARGRIQFDSYLLKKADFKLELKDKIDLPIELGFFALKPTRFGFIDREITLLGEGSRGNVDLRMDGEVDLAMAEFFTSTIESIRGFAKTQIRMTGPLKDLKVVGDLQFQKAYVLMKFMPTPFEEMEGSIRIRQGTIWIDSIESYLADDLFSLSGKIETYSDRFPELDLRANFENNRVKFPPLDWVQVRGYAKITGQQPPYTIGGNLDVIQALYSQSFGATAGATQRGERFAPTRTDALAKQGPFVMDLNITANQGFLIRNEVLDAEFRGKVKLKGPPAQPILLGDASVVQGKIRFRDRPFNLESVSILMDDPVQFSPRYNVSAVSEVNQYKIRLVASGKGSRLKAEFSSSPFLPESEIYSLLSTGMTTTDPGRFIGARDRTYVNQGEAAALILNSMDFNQDIQKKTGFQFDVREAIDQQNANSIFSQNTPGANVAAPKVVLKRNLGRNINLSVGSTVGVGTTTVREANAEYRLNQGFSFIGVWNDFEGVNTQDTRTSYGVDVRLNKKFK